MYLFLPLFFVLLRRFVSLWVVFVLWTASTLLAVAATQPGLPRMYHGAVFPPMFIAGMVAFKLLLRAPPPARAIYCLQEHGLYSSLALLS